MPEKNETDLLVLAEAERRNLPVLGICFGMQILNVARGGSLIQDIGSQVEGSIKHEQGIPLERESHALRPEDNSRISRLLGDDIKIAKVNSHHHQAVKAVGTHLVASAFAPDGIIEAIEDDRDGRFVIGVQWHPELGWRDNEISRRIFVAFIEECTLRHEVDSR
ncbi:MAG: gamma-glutamyl-gamma-aminobutyrate hydrolase family protein [Blastocatellia bacterium]|nr:gamma-glutamyl-gamma-aminobutyrate hydrolase family protein [Blastocatellia bacterium]